MDVALTGIMPPLLLLLLLLPMRFAVSCLQSLQQQCAQERERRRDARVRLLSHFKAV